MRPCGLELWLVHPEQPQAALPVARGWEVRSHPRPGLPHALRFTREACSSRVDVRPPGSAQTLRSAASRAGSRLSLEFSDRAVAPTCRSLSVCTMRTAVEIEASI